MGEFLAYWWIWVPALELGWVMGVSVWILFDGRSATATMSWIMVLSFLPFLGLPLYFFLGPRKFDRKRRRLVRAQKAVREAWQELMGKDVPEEPDDAHHLRRMSERANGHSARPRPAKVTIYTDGAEVYSAIEEAILASEHHVHIEYYIWLPDESGARLRDACTKVARKGVEVRVLIDGLGSGAANDRFWKPLRDAGGKIARFNAPGMGRWRPTLTNFRTHRKIVVCDGVVGFTGGMNVTDVHTSAVSGEEAWRDTHLKLEGPAVSGLQSVFFENWCYSTDAAPDRDEYFREDAPVLDGSSNVQIVASGPDEQVDAIHKLFFSAIARADSKVELVSPYFVPDRPIMDALVAAALRGADVSVLVPTDGDVPLVAAAARSYYPELLGLGVKIFEYGPPVLHAKTLLVDDDVAIIGTANMDPRSFRLNFELVAAIYDKRACEELEEDFRQDLEHARPVTLEGLQALPFRARLFSAVARLFSPVL